jgi:hypothetical protein
MINTDECLLWARYTDPRGYGRVSNKVNGVWRSQPAHRALYEAQHGEVPKHLVMDHLCRVTRCINLEHLEPVTNQVNIQRGIRTAPKATHCKFGHEFTETNTINRKNGTRNCKQCQYRLYNERYARISHSGY